MKLKWLLLFPALLFIVPQVFATTYYLQILNPNDYDLTDFQIKINLTQYNISAPVAQIVTLNGTNVPFCYEQPNGECNQTESNIIWMKVPLIKGKDYTILKVIVNGTNGATNGYQVFDFYDDFNDGIADWTIYNRGAQYEYYEQNGMLVLKETVDKSYGFDVLVVKENVVPYSNAFTVETKVYIDIDDSWHYAGFLLPGEAFVYGAGHENYDNEHIAFVGQPNNEFNLIYNAVGDPIIIVGTGLSYTTKANWFIRVSYKDGVIKGYVKKLDTGQEWVNSISHTFQWKRSVAYFTEFPYNTIKADWVRVRKYADQDPIVKQAYARSSLSPQPPSPAQSEYSQTYLYVRQVNILPENIVSVSNAPIIIELNTTKLISEGKMKSDCSDIYVTYYDPLYGEVPAKFWVDPVTCNTGRTRIYVKLPVVSVNNDYIINVYYGSPDAIPVWDPKNTFSFYVDLTNPSDISQNLIIRTEGTTTLDYTSSGLQITTGSDGKVVIINK